MYNAGERQPRELLTIDRRDEPMLCRSKILIPVILSVGLAAAEGTARGDTVELRNGGELRGGLLTTPGELASAREISILTLSGATVSVSRGEILRIGRRRPTRQQSGPA